MLGACGWPLFVFSTKKSGQEVLSGPLWFAARCTRSKPPRPTSDGYSLLGRLCGAAIALFYITGNSLAPTRRRGRPTHDACRPPPFFSDAPARPLLCVTESPLASQTTSLPVVGPSRPSAAVCVGALDGYSGQRGRPARRRSSPPLLRRKGPWSPTILARAKSKRANEGTSSL